MLRITKKVFDNIKNPNYIIFNGIIRTSFTEVHDELSHKITFFDKDVNKSMQYNDYINLCKKYNRENGLIDYKNQADIYTNQIISSLKIFPTDMQKIFIDDISNNTYFKRYFEDYNITSLMRKYQVEPAEIFGFLAQPYKKITQFNNLEGFFNKYESNMIYYKNEFNSLKKNYSNASDNNSSIYIDYYKTVALKCSIPYNLSYPMIINPRRYQDRNGHILFPKLFHLIAYKLNKNPELKDNKNYIIYEDDIPSARKVDKIINKISKYVNNLKNDEHIEIFNNKIKHTIKIPEEDKLSDEYTIYNTIINKKIQSWFNHRYDILDKKKVWGYMMEQFYNEYVKDSINKYEIDNLIYLGYKNPERIRFKYDSNYSMDELSIVNMIIYGKTNINQNILERILPLIRFQENNKYEYIQLDNYVILNKQRYHHSAPSYEILFKDDNIYELAFVEKEIDKQKIVRGLLRLMNEVNPEHLNFNNYYQLYLWEYRNDSIVQFINNKKSNYESENKSYNKLFKNLSDYKNL